MAGPVLTLQALTRGGVTFLRSLGEKGIPVVAADSDRLSAGFFSRDCSRRLVYPNPEVNEGAFREFVFSELVRHKYDLVVPMFDATLLPLARNKGEVEALARFPFLDHQSLMQGRDKAWTVAIAQQCGIRVPATHTVDSEEQVESALDSLEMPVIVRPRETSRSRGLRLVADREDVWRAWREVSDCFGPAVIQEYVPWGGFTYDVDVLMNRNSEPRAVFVAKRLRTYPPLAGPTGCGQGVEYPELADTAVRLLRKMGWCGPAEVEFRIDPRDGQPTLMEVNPRLWGSLYTAMVAGVDFPYLLYRMAMDGDVEPVLKYRTDRRARYFFMVDMLCMATHPRKRTIAREWFGDFVNPNTSLALPSAKDPLPLLGEILATLVYGLRPSRFKLRMRVIRQQRKMLN
ncbi:ATP-grasp domain-containing protein [Chloroflexota bacterium]